MGHAVCWNCFEDSYLAAISKKNGNKVACSVCGNKRRKGFTVEELGKELEPVIRENFQLGEFYRKFSGEDDDHGYEEQEGDDLNYVVQEVLGQYFEFEDEIVDAVIDAEDVWPPDGDIPFFDTTSNYVHVPIRAGSLHDQWRCLGEELKHRRRFFCEQANELFGWVFQGIDKVVSRHPIAKEASVVRELPVGTEIYRARVCDDHLQQRMFDAPFKEVGPPPKEFASEGRMNPKGVVVLYTALERDTCLAEIRPSIGHRVVSIALETIRPLRILDFSWLADALDRRNQSYFQPDYMRVVERGVFLKHLSYLISQPVVPGKEYEYLITQAMGEYLAHVHPEPFDGVMFDSVQQQAGRNIVLFPDNSLLTAEVDELFGVKYVAGSVTLHAITGLSYSHEVEDVYVDNQGEVLALNGFDDHDHDYDYDEVEL